MPNPSTSEQRVVRGPASARVYTRWRADDLEIAEALTNGGNLQRAADLCWALLGDGRVRAALETRTKGLLKLPLDFEESGDKRSSGRVATALRDGDFAKAHSEAALCSLAMWGILLGIGLAQRVWELHGGRWLGVLRPYDARNLRWDAQGRRWMVRTAEGDVEIRRGDRRWVLYAPSCSGWPEGDERPWMYGAWRACSKPWLGKDLSWTDWQHHEEVHGSPIRTADVDAEKPPSEPVVRDFGAVYADIGGDTALIPPAGLKLRLLEAVAATWEMFPAAIAVAAVEIVVAITGQASSTEITKGQDTGATLHKLVRQDLIDADAETLSTCLHDQSLVDYAEVNFTREHDASNDRARELAPWPAWKTDPPADVGAKGAALKALGEGIAAIERVLPAGKVLDRAALFEEAGIPLLDATEAPALPPAVSPPADAPPPGEADAAPAEDLADAA